MFETPSSSEAVAVAPAARLRRPRARRIRENGQVAASVSAPRPSAYSASRATWKLSQIAYA